MKKAEYVWMDGEIVPWEEATVHVTTHALHLGTSVFEGIRFYESEKGFPVFFRLTDHIKRLFRSAEAYYFDVPFNRSEINSACKDVVFKNNMKRGYLRPLFFQGAGGLGVVPGDQSTVQGTIISQEWDFYLGQGAIKEGIKVCVSSWKRISSLSNPVLAKAGGHYLNSRLIKFEAIRNGFDEGIALDSDGCISEGSSENIFLVLDGELLTPPVSCSILAGFTRDSVIKLSESLDIATRVENVPRDLLCMADEIFLTGTAAEITPVVSVDGISIGDGVPGPITSKLQRTFFGLFDGSTADDWGWLER